METIIGNTREYLYENILPKNSICVEIGVSGGENAERIIRISDPKKLYLIDMWDHSNYRNLPPYYSSKPYNDDKQITYNNVKNKFENNKSVEIIRDFSVNASKQFEDNYFDWTYIDGSHDYLSVKEDIECWWPKIKLNGFLCGHDYGNKDVPAHGGILEIGVKKAVDEFIENNNLKLYYKGNNSDIQISDWCIIKL